MIGESRLGGPEHPDPAVTTGPAAGETAAETAAAAERTHAAAVQAHRAASGWGPDSAAELAMLTSRVGKLQRQSPTGPVGAVLAVLVVAADLGLTGFAIVCALTGEGDAADEGVLFLLAMFVPTVWAAWTLARLVQGRREQRYRAARDRLRLAGGCGDPGCVRCR